MVESVSIVFQLAIIEGCQLPAKDRNASLNPFVVVLLNNRKAQTFVVRGSLNPFWDQMFNFSVEPSDFPLSLQLICYDKTRIGKNYIGEANLSTHHLVLGEFPKTWGRSGVENLQLVDYKNKKNPCQEPGFIKVRYGFVTSEDDLCDFVSWRGIWDAISAQNLPIYRGMYQSAKSSLAHSPSLDTSAKDFDDTEKELTEATTEDLMFHQEIANPPISALSSDEPLEADTQNPLLGVVFIDIVSSRELPYDRNLTRTSFDMDPFVVITHGKETFKTRFIRHTLNPTWNERLYFHVRRSYLNHTIKFSVYDHDKFSNNDFVGSCAMTVQDLLHIKGGMPMSEKTIPLALAKDKWKGVFESSLTIRTGFKAVEDLRRTFWSELAKRYDLDESDSLNHFEVLAMLESLQAVAPEKLAREFFTESGKSPNTEELSFPELATCFESYVRENNWDLLRGPSLAQGRNLFQIPTCPICNSTNLEGVDIMMHIAICCMSDPEVQVDRWMVSDFVPEAYAQRKWFTRAVNRLGYGRYRIGQNNANIIVQDRATGQLIEEKIPAYIRLGIRLLYKNIASKSAVDIRAIRRLLKTSSLKQGRKFDDPVSVRDIRPFIQFHQINTDEIQDPLESFQNFNQFFYRKLKPGSRPLASPDDPRVVVSPADCRCTCFSTIDKATRLWIKGEEFSIARLLGNLSEESQALAQIFENGSLAIFRLAPQDYHRFHFPVDGRVRSHQHIDGHYFTVNPMAVRSGLDVFGENKRSVSIIESEQFGLVGYVSIGAMMVGSIELTCEAGQRYSRMDEFGYFAFGGSTIVLIFQQGMVKFDADLEENSQHFLETLIRVGSSIGTRPDAL
ncbi:hypothetical protein K493DRAFT_278223 [Basidiobolus meristosporus CBS 931.73]|uniref:Phosphatidylserine decarboxylase proenzyme 2 n=1 Tax=Basidiobolus meristosporus CBS 931.73 TaxID=1314790 RepID=A0A1Y1YSZ2_9FUNG|nr:hypothetical protein K493DRAFT_278223 [Basidiobolus meristosporus CBS 931.73]|eukprot:ORY01148.1 hypothetical protein K493DRAFT_278223 [Basidiobolus meristosporus CBS 931.73]